MIYSLFKAKISEKDVVVGAQSYEKEALTSGFAVANPFGGNTVSTTRETLFMGE